MYRVFVRDENIAFQLWQFRALFALLSVETYRKGWQPNPFLEGGKCKRYDDVGQKAQSGGLLPALQEKWL